MRRSVTQQQRQSWQQGLTNDSVKPLVWQAPPTLTSQELAELTRLSKFAAEDVSMGLLTGRLHAFRCGGLLLLVSQVGKVLEVNAALQTGKAGASWRAMVYNMRRLAKAWGCTEIGTATFDERVAKLLETLGLRTVERRMMLEISDEQ